MVEMPKIKAEREAKKEQKRLARKGEKRATDHEYQQFATYDKQGCNMWQTSSPDVTNKLARCDEHITENKAESSNKPDGNFLDFDTQSEEVKTQQQSEISKPVFDFDLVLAWILTQFENSGWFTLDAMDKAFVSAKLEEYQQRYQKPNKGDALSFVDIAMRQRHGIERRSMKASAARDEVNNAVTRQLKAQAEVVEQHTRNMKPKSFEEKQADRTWANE